MIMSSKDNQPEIVRDIRAAQARADALLAKQKKTQATWLTVDASELDDDVNPKSPQG